MHAFRSRSSFWLAGVSFVGIWAVVFLACTAVVPGAKPLPPPPAPANPAIAFIKYINKAGGSYHLAVMNADGARATTLLPIDHPVGGPSWSPDGKHIAFATTTGPWDDLYVLTLAVVNDVPQCTDLQLLTNEDALGPAWSPNGKWIAYARGDSNLRVIPVDGNGRPSGVAVTVSGPELGPDSPGAWGGLTWDPTSCRIAFVNYRGAPIHGIVSLWIADAVAEGETREVIPEGLFTEIGSPEWSRFGGEIIFDGVQTGETDHNLYTLDPVTGAWECLRDGGSMWSPCWSPTDNVVAFQYGYGSITLLDLSTGSIRSLTSGLLPDWRR